MSALEFGAGIRMFQQFVDRYATDAYGPPVGTVAAIHRAAEVGDITCLDINYPFAGEGTSLADVREALERTGIRAEAITPHLCMREYQLGSFTNPDPKVRQKAVDLGMKAIEVARELGAHYVEFWPGQDGFDYPFQVDYQQIWEHEIDGVRTVAQSDPGMQFAIAYKTKEPHVHMLFSTAARTLSAIDDMGVDNVGIVLDLGHSLFAKETPADVLQLVSRRGKLVSVEVNDNWRDWDDDMTVGSVHLGETLEFLLALRKIDWKGPILLDQFPFREDPVAAGKHSISVIRRLDALLDDLDLDALRQAQAAHDSLGAQRMVVDLLLGRGGHTP